MQQQSGNARLTIYKASAGSGKTFTLAVEYIRRLVENPAAVFAYRETLAVTFTNKATAEMKDRILEALYAIAHSLPSGEAYLKAIMKTLPPLGKSGEAIVRERCLLALGYILHDYSHFRVETIDAFFQSIVRDLAHELGLTAGLQTELDTTTATSDAVDFIFDNLDSDNHTQGTTSSGNKLRTRITRFVKQRIEEGRSWNVLRAVKRFATHIFDAEYQDASPTLAPLLQDEDFLRTYIKEIDSLSAAASERVMQCIEQLEGAVQEYGIEFEHFSNGRYITSHIAKVRQGVLGDFGKSLVNFIAEPMKLLRKADQHKPEMQAAAQRVAEQLGTLQQVEAQGALAKNTASLIRSNLNELCLLGAIEGEVNRITAQRGSFLLANTPQLLARLVAQGDTPFIYEKMGARLTHVMLDEFQDTSRRQWHNFRTLLDDNMDRGGSTLVVGDVKQSIYRWRDGDWQILHRLNDEMSRYAPKEIQLSTNWRSYSEIIGFNNSLYNNAASLLGLTDIYSDVHQEATPAKQGGYVQLTYFPKNVKTHIQQTLDEMCRHIADMHDTYGVPWHKMAILIRNNSDEAAIASAFDNILPGVPLVSGGVFRLGSSNAIRIITDALRCLHDPTNHPAMACLRYAVAQLRAPGYSLQTLIQPEPNDSAVTTYFAQRDKLIRMPLYELVMHTVAHFSLSSMDGQAAYLLTFYDQLQSFLSRHPVGIAQFLEHYDNTICNATVAGCEVDGVNVLTIHKAKGLEWHTVFIPFADWPIERDREMLWCSTHDIKPYCALPIVPVETGKRMAASIFVTEYEHEKEQQRADNLNLLYVATTRPCNNLFIWGKDTARLNAIGIVHQSITQGWEQDEDGQAERYTTGSFAHFNNSAESNDNKPKERADKSAEADDDKSKNTNRLHPIYTAVNVDTQPFPAMTTFVQSGEAERFWDSKDTSYIEQGKLLHAIFEQLHTADDLPQVLARFESRGLISSNEMRERVERLVRAGLNNPKVAPWFAPGLTLFNECNILTTDTNGSLSERRPDRVIITDDHITVIDYKFGQPKDTYTTQVQEYKQLLATMYPAHTIDSYLWYVYQNNVIKV